MAGFFDKIQYVRFPVFEFLATGVDGLVPADAIQSFKGKLGGVGFDFWIFFIEFRIKKTVSFTDKHIMTWDQRD